MPSDRYGPDVLNTDWRAPRRGRSVEMQAERGLVVEEVTTDWCGEIVRVDRDLGTVELEERGGRRRTFPLGPGFLLEGRPVILRAPARVAPLGATRTASGSRAVSGGRARVARASRIFVEGRHDAELVEKVWGDDLRGEGVVVEYLEGVDDLVEQLRDFRPGPDRRVGVLVDHLVPGSKESRVAASVSRGPLGRDVLSSAIRSSTSGRRSGRRGSASTSGQASLATSRGSTECVSSWAGRTATRPTSPGRGSTSCPASRRTPIWSRRYWAGSRS